MHYSGSVLRALSGQYGATLETLQDIPEATEDWWATVQEDIRQSEYHQAGEGRSFEKDRFSQSAQDG